MIAHVAAFVVRCGLVMLFLPFSALDKLANWRGAVAQAAGLVPGAGASVLILLGLGVEVFMSLGVVSGVADRLAALVLAGYCAMTAVLFKQFWKQGDFWQGGRGRELFWDFLKNLSLGAGFLLIVVGLDGQGLAAFAAHPLASTHPYSYPR